MKGVWNWKEKCDSYNGSDTMKSQDGKEGSGQVKAAIIAGIFTLIAACIGGIFLIINTLVDNDELSVGNANS